MPDITIFSLDYDDCADILFQEDKQLNPAQQTRKKEFLFYLNELTSGAKQVEVYVGSLRQDRHGNKVNMEKFNNGDCFENYAALCSG